MRIKHHVLPLLAVLVLSVGSLQAQTITPNRLLKWFDQFGTQTDSRITESDNGDVLIGNVPNPIFTGSKSLYFSVENPGVSQLNSFRINAANIGQGFDSLFLAAESNPGSTTGAGISFITAVAGGIQSSRMDIAPNGNVFVSGKVFANGGFNGKCADNAPLPGLPIFCNQDVAETFAAREATEPGDLVVLVNQSASMPAVRKSARPYEGLLIGAVSTNPGLVFDRGETHLAGDNSRLITSDKTVVGLVGRVPVKVSLENGPIAVGDPLTSSSTAGVAMRATSGGQIIGYALEKADQKGKILVHVQPGYYIPPKLLAVLNRQDLFVADLTAQQAQIEELKSQLGKLESLLQAGVVQRPEKSASVGLERKAHEEALTKGDANQATRSAEVTK